MLVGHKWKDKIVWERVKSDWQYIILNKLVNQIPCWTLRRYIYKKMGMKIGEEARIGIGTIIVNPQGIKIGHRSVINENCFLDGRGGLVIGHDTSISFYSKIITASHLSNGESFDYYSKRTRLGNYVWVGASAIILDGSLIKDYTVIGSGTVVKGNSEERDILVGNPAKCIKKREVKCRYQIKYKPYFR